MDPFDIILSNSDLLHAIVSNILVSGCIIPYLIITKEIVWILHVQYEIVLIVSCCPYSLILHYIVEVVIVLIIIIINLFNAFEILILLQAIDINLIGIPIIVSHSGITYGIITISISITLMVLQVVIVSVIGSHSIVSNFTNFNLCHNILDKIQVYCILYN